MENKNENKESIESVINNHLQIVNSYIEDVGSPTKQIVCRSTAITSLGVIKDFIKTCFFCKDFGIDPVFTPGKNVIWGKKPNEKWELILESNGTDGAKQRVYKYKKIEVPEEQAKDYNQSQALIIETCEELKEMLLDKNRKYGDSALNPKRIFSKADPIEQINVRIDDKLSRIKSGQIDEDEDVESDLLGYLILKNVAKKIQAIRNYKIPAEK